jgi:WD40 repeat protein
MRIKRAATAAILSTVVLVGAAPAASASPPAGAEVFAPGVVSTEAEEWRIGFTPDGRTAYFGRSADYFPVSRQATILETRRRGGGWTTPVPASFSGVYSDIDPFVTADGRRLFFSSIRPVDGQPRADVDIWMVERTRRGWGEPVNVGAPNGPGDELYPTVTADGTLYFASDRPGGLGGFDIYRSRRGRDGAYLPAENVGAPVNGAGWEFNPAVVPTGNLMVFASLERPGGYGSGDLWASVLVGGRWTAPRNLGPVVNTAQDEYHPVFSPRFDRLYFIRHSYEPWVPGDVYSVPVAALLRR